MENITESNRQHSGNRQVMNDVAGRIRCRFSERGVVCQCKFLQCGFSLGGAGCAEKCKCGCAAVGSGKNSHSDFIPDPASDLLIGIKTVIAFQLRKIIAAFISQSFMLQISIVLLVEQLKIADAEACI